MKKILLILLLILPVVSAVEITGFINDEAEILTDAERQQIEPILQGLYDQDLAEFAIVTVNSLDGRDIGGYAFELAEGKLGKKDKNNGLLLLVALKDRKYRFEVGRGLEPVLPDGKIGRIGRTYLVENFRAGQYGNGIREAVLAVQAILTQDAESEYYVQAVNPNAAIGGIVMLIIFILFIIVIVKSSKKGKRGASDYFLAALMAGSMMRGRGGLGGGFGGFGGGGFGGGGAGGGW
jgi:uncharacterized protein